MKIILQYSLSSILGVFPDKLGAIALINLPHETADKIKLIRLSKGIKLWKL